MKLIIPFEVKSLDDTTGEFEGYGSTFGNVDLGGDICKKGCFDRTLSEWKERGTLPPLLFGHNFDEPIGDISVIGPTNEGLRLKGALWLGSTPIPKAVQAYRMLKGSGPKGFSMGYVTQKSSYDKSGSRILEEVDLLEISAVSFPMNLKATVLKVKGLRSVDGSVLDPRTVESMLRDELGLSVRDAKAFMAEGYKALSRERDVDDSKELAGLYQSLEALNTSLRA